MALITEDEIKAFAERIYSASGAGIISGMNVKITDMSKATSEAIVRVIIDIIEAKTR